MYKTRDAKEFRARQRMGKLHRLRDSLDASDERILEDGEVLRVPMMALDSTQRAVRDHYAPVWDAVRTQEHMKLHDGMGNPAGHKPGYAFDGHARDARDAAYQEYKRNLSDAWKTPQQREQQPAHDSRPAPQVSPSTAQARRNHAYQEYCSRLSDAWRNPR